MENIVIFVVRELVYREASDLMAARLSVSEFIF